LEAQIINYDVKDPMDFKKKKLSGKGTICLDAVGYEAVGHMAGYISMRGGNGIKI
jgi:S-(hydroxymethyl)glutathione dehydrogenase / alcohol dehydrogenase